MTPSNFLLNSLGCAALCAIPTVTILFMCKKKSPKSKKSAASKMSKLEKDGKGAVKNETKVDGPKKSNKDQMPALENKKEPSKKSVKEKPKSVKEKPKSVKEKSKSKKSVKELSLKSKSKKDVDEKKKDTKSEKKEKSKSKKEPSKKDTLVDHDKEAKKSKSKKDASQLDAAIAKDKGSKKGKSKKEASKKSDAADKNKASKPSDGKKADVDDEKKDADSKVKEVLDDLKGAAAKKLASKKEASKKQVPKDKNEVEKGDDKNEMAEGKKKEDNQKEQDGDSHRTATSQKIAKELVIDPKELRFAPSGGLIKLNLENNTGMRLAVKIKCSDNEIYRLNPVFMIIDKDGKSSVDVSRIDGTAKPDKLVIVYTEAASDASDAQLVFKAGDIPADKITSVNVPMFVN